MRVLVLLFLMMQLFCPALAQPVTEIWRETITAYEREISFDVMVEIPDGGELGIYRVRTVSARESQGEPPRRTQPEKRRGVAYRTKPEEVVAVSDIDRM